MAQQEKDKTENAEEEIEDKTPRLNNFYFQGEEGLVKLRAKTLEEAQVRAESIRKKGDEVGELLGIGDQKVTSNAVLVNPIIINPRIQVTRGLKLSNPVYVSGEKDGTTGETIHIMIKADRIHLEPQTSAPSNPVKGDIYFNTNGHPYSYTGSEWKTMDNQGS